MSSDDLSQYAADDFVANRGRGESFTLNEVNVPYFNATAPGAKICSSSATNVSVGVTR